MNDNLDKIVTVESLRDKFSSTIKAEQLISEFPRDFPASCIIEGFVANLGNTMDTIMVDIKKEAQDNESEVARIVRGVYVGIYNSREEDGKPVISGFHNYHDYKDEKTTIIEYNLSFAMWSCNRSIYQLKHYDLEDAFYWLGQAKVCIGVASGLRSAIDENEIKKKMQSDVAAAIRHSENREMKAEAIKYYQDNRESLGSKDDAAYELKKIVPAKVSTIRKWLKNI